MVIFHSYVSLPEGQRVSISDYLYIIILDLLIRGSPPPKNLHLLDSRVMVDFPLDKAVTRPAQTAPATGGSARASTWHFQALPLSHSSDPRGWRVPHGFHLVVEP